VSRPRPRQVTIAVPVLRHGLARIVAAHGHMVAGRPIARPPSQGRIVTMLLAEERRQVLAYSRRMLADGLVVGTSGNVSVRSGDMVAVTPTGVGYAELTAESIGVHGLDGTAVEAAFAPTSELPMHLAVYASTGTGAIVHTHSAAATAVSLLVDELPSIHYLVGLFGGPVRVARYAAYGTAELADSVLAALDGRTGCLMANHGALVHAETPARAYEHARNLEWLCEVYLRAAAVGPPRVLPADEIERIGRRLASYGPRPA
jgi:L-fuculose-phosphate aldolase